MLPKYATHKENPMNLIALPQPSREASQSNASISISPQPSKG